VRRGLRVVLLTLLLYAGILGLFLVVVSAMLRSPEGGGLGFGPRVAVVELEGIILDVEDIVRELKTHRDNPLVRAVVVRINSPGGVVGPTQELFRAVQRLREAGKPVVASLGAVAASGGYYVAVAADTIYANPGTLTGSIGVIMQMANLENLMKKVPSRPCSTTSIASSSMPSPKVASSIVAGWCSSPTAACSPAPRPRPCP
jgi:protease IV